MSPRERLTSSMAAERARLGIDRTHEQVEPILKGVRESKGLRRGGLRRTPARRSEIPPASLAVVEARSGGRCEVCDRIARVDPSWTPCDGMADDPHHRRRQGPGSARGGGHMPENLLAACRRAHIDWIHNPRRESAARRAGLLVLPGDPGFDELGIEK